MTKRILNFELKVWWVLISFILVVVFYLIVFKALKKRVPEPEFLKYNQDLFKSQKWTWTWRFNEKQKNWYVYNIRAHCPHCDTTMIPYSPGSCQAFTCPRCDFDGNHLQFADSSIINHLINDNLERIEKGLPRIP